MTPELIVLGPTATVADALAQIRDPDWVVSIAAQVFVCQPPFKAPTGKFLGTAHVQRLLREAPSLELRHCVSNDPVVGPEATDRAVAELLARVRHARRRGVRRRRASCSARSPSTTCSTASSGRSGANVAVAPTRRGPRSHGQASRGPHRPARSTPARRELRQEAFGRFAESIARFLGTARFLVWQTAVIIDLDPLEPAGARSDWQFDPWDRGLVLLTLVLSLQASYAAPLILLAAEPPGGARPHAVRERPDRRRAHAGRHRVPRPRDRERAPDARRRRDRRGAPRPARRARHLDRSARPGGSTTAARRSTESGLR